MLDGVAEGDAITLAQLRQRGGETPPDAVTARLAGR